MSLNLTAAYLQARRATTLLGFSGHLGTSSSWIAGPGGLAGNGFAMPHAGVIRGLQVYNGITLRSSSGSNHFDAGDTIALFATYDGSSSFALAVAINGALSAVTVASVPASSNIYATVELTLEEEA